MILVERLCMIFILYCFQSKESAEIDQPFLAVYVAKIVKVQFPSALSFVNPVDKPLGCAQGRFRESRQAASGGMKRKRIIAVVILATLVVAVVIGSSRDTKVTVF